MDGGGVCARGHSERRPQAGPPIGTPSGQWPSTARSTATASMVGGSCRRPVIDRVTRHRFRANGRSTLSVVSRVHGVIFYCYVLHIIFCVLIVVVVVDRCYCVTTARFSPRLLSKQVDHPPPTVGYRRRFSSRYLLLCSRLCRTGIVMILDF